MLLVVVFDVVVVLERVEFGEEVVLDGVVLFIPFEVVLPGDVELVVLVDADVEFDVSC